MQLSRVAVSCVVLAVAACVASVGARTELHEAVAADLSEPTWISAEYADADSANKPLTAEQRFRQELYYELHPERVVKPEAVKIRFLQDGVTLEQAHEEGGQVEVEADADADATAETDSESQAEGEAEAESDSGAESDAEADAEADADAESEEAAASMRPLENAEAEEEAADARYRMDSVLHADMPLPVPLPNAAHTQVAATMDAMRFAQHSAMVAANTAAHAQQQAAALGGATASAQQQALMWSAEKQAALDAFLEADDMDEEDLDTDEDEDEGEDQDQADSESDEESGEQQMLEMRAEHAVHERTRFGRGAAARMGMPDYERRAEDEEQMMGGAREYDSDAEDVSDLMAAQEEVDAHAGAVTPRAPGHAHDQYGGDMRFARVHAPLPENKDSRLYYARSRRGDKIRRMIKRGEMLYRYAPELMSKVFDPARKVEKPGVSPTFGQAMDGPLGPITPPPLGGAAKPKKGSVGPAFFQMNERAHAQHQQQHQQHTEAEAEAGAREDGDEAESGGASKPAKGEKGSKEWIAKKMAEIDTLIKNPYAQAEKYPAMYQHWDNYMYPLRNRPLPPRFYPYPQKGRNPISAFPPSAALFESPPPQRGPLQTPNALFQNPRGLGGLQPLPAPFAPIGQPSAPSPYASPLGLARFPGGGVPQGGDAANNGVLGPKNHPVFSAHPLPLQKWYQKFLQPAEAPAMAKPPGAKGGDAEAGSGGGEGEGEGDFF